MVNQDLYNVIDQITEIGQRAELAFGHLSAEQINWKPSADGWSVGQCFEHLIKSNSLFFPELERVAGGGRKNSFLENYSPLSSFFGNLLVNSLKKDERKFKAPSKAIVPPSEIDASIVELFAAHQMDLIERVKSTETADWQKTKITSPFMKLITYTLADGFRVVLEHERRHVRQAERVVRAENFPKR
jgi:hypothetical protein